MDTMPSTAYHSPFVAAFNRDAAGRDPIDLSEAALIAAARQAAGVHDFDDASFLPAMRSLLSALDGEAQLNAYGRFVARARSVGALKNQLLAGACLAAHPDIRQRPITAPIIIVGPHRSGTTRLHMLLAADPRWRHLKAWEGINPGPDPAQPDRGRAARYDAVRQALDARAAIYPGTAAAHPMHADWPEEEMLLLNHAFAGFTPLGLYCVPSYYRWFLAADKTAAYRRMADLMRLIAWEHDVGMDRRWVLKNPQHMLDLETLLAVFPDAKLIFTHRDPVKTVGSTLSLMWLYTVQHTDVACRAGVRDVWLDFCEQAAHRCALARERIPAAQQLDVYYADVSRDWRAVMRRIYAFVGIDFGAEAETAMAEWLQQSDTRRHDPHRYRLDDFGVDRDAVAARFGFVRQRYAIPDEPDASA